MIKDIRDKIDKIPLTSGVYIMKDKEGQIIYIGKSKKLQNRVKSYFINSSSHSRKTQRMVKGIADIEIITTDTELDALLLECEMIKKIRPMYNKLMKNHENYTYLKIDLSEEYPFIQVSNEVNDESLYFGPYTRASKLEGIKNIIDETLKLRRCKNMNKCINYDLKKCLGPCRNKITKESYNSIIQMLIKDLSGKETNMINILQKEMEQEIGKLNFENASKIKGFIDNIKSLSNKQEIINNSTNNEKILAWIKINEDEYKIYVIKSGKLLKTEKKNEKFLCDLDKENYLEKITNENTIVDNHEKDDAIVDKFDIDFINIIYSYIKYNKDIEYILR